MARHYEPAMLGCEYNAAAALLLSMLRLVSCSRAGVTFPSPIAASSVPDVRYLDASKNHLHACSIPEM